MDLHKRSLEAIATLTPDQYLAILEGMKMQISQDIKAAKFDNAFKMSFGIIQLSTMLEGYETLIIALCNLGSRWQNSRVYDVASVFAAEAYDVANEHNLLEMKLKALQVRSLVYTNQQDTEKHIATME